MIIRDLRKDEYYKDGALSCMAGWCKLDLEEEKKKELDYTIVGCYADDGATLMSKIVAGVNPSSYCGHSFPALCIGGVATAPMYRRSGGVRAIFHELLQNRTEKEGWVFSFLYPFSFNYYRQFGYERILHWNSVTFPIASLQHLPRYSENVLPADSEDALSGTGRNVLLYEGEEAVLEHLVRLYNNFAKRYEVAFLRDLKTRSYSNKPHLSGQWTFYTDEAYVTVEKKDKVLWVSEIVYNDADALTHMLSFLRMFDGQVETIKFVNLPEHSEVDYLLADYGIIETCQYNGFMGRVLQVQKALEMYTYPQESGSIAIKVEDPIIDANNGVFTVSYADGKAVSVARTAAAAASVDNAAGTADATGTADAARAAGTDADIEITIPALTRLLLGDVPVYASQMAYMPGITWHCDYEKVRRIFISKDARIYDFF